MAGVGIERAERAGAGRAQQRLGERMIGVTFKRRMQNPVYGLVRVEEFQHAKRIAHVPLHAHAERLDALQELEGIGRR